MHRVFGCCGGLGNQTFIKALVAVEAASVSVLSFLRDGIIYNVDLEFEAVRCSEYVPGGRAAA